MTSPNEGSAPWAAAGGETSADHGAGHRVGVTGGSGRLGRAVLQELGNHGYATTNFDQVPDGNLADEYVRGDILDGEHVARWLKGCDRLIHLAAIPAPGSASADWLTQVNVLGTYRVLAAAVSVGISQIVVASSVSALGLAWGRRFLPAYLPIDEAVPLSPEDEYGVSKQVNEIYAATFARRHHLRIALLRFPAIVGLETIEAFRAQLAGDKELGARMLWSYVDIADAARACRLALPGETPGAHPYYIAAGDNLAGGELEAGLREYFPGVVFRGNFASGGSLISTAAAQAAFGYRPQVAWGTPSAPSCNQIREE